jgi:hypothetical protein
MSVDETLPSDPFIQLLTDALRAGPTSPEWQEAVDRLSTGHTGPVDEYKLLMQARDNLAAGKAYREVRAGPGFTRKVLADIDKDVAATAAKKNPMSAGLISLLGGGLMVLALMTIIFWVIQGSGGPVVPEDLANEFFGKPLGETATLTAPLPLGWKLIGPLPLDPLHNLTPQVKQSSADYQGGAVVSTGGIPSSESFSVEATFDFQHVSDEVVPQLFVTDDPNFSPDKATSPHEIAWMVRGGLAQVVLPNGELSSSAKKMNDGQSTSARIVIGARDAVVFCDGQIIWSGPSQLATDKLRYVGVRILCRKDDKRSIVSVKDLREMGK